MKTMAPKPMSNLCRIVRHDLPYFASSYKVIKRSLSKPFLKDLYNFLHICINIFCNEIYIFCHTLF
jgi:hypothetical protein